MSSLALMRWLETAPNRYEAGMRVLTLGRVTALHDAVACAAASKPGRDVLEIGCGTGAVTRRLVARGARVTALDQSAEMLDRAREQAGATEVRWLEQTASEIDALPPRAFDAVVLSLSLSEMSEDERRFVLARAGERLRPGGCVVAADEVRAPAGVRRALQVLARAPQWLLAWLLAGSVSVPVADLSGDLASAGLVVRHEQRWLLGTLALYVAEPAT